jgi:hypothetical protein
MSYAAIPQNDPILDEASRPVDKRKAAAGAAIFTLLLVLCVFLRFFSKLDPIPEPKGLVAAFDNIEIEETGGGGGGGSQSSEEQRTQNQSSSSKSKEIETNDDIKSDVNISRGNSKDADVKPDPGQDFNDFKKENQNNTSNNTNNNNLGPVGPVSGNGKGYGNGSEEGNGTSLCVNNCLCDNSKWDIDILEVTAWITIEINENGSVNSARFAETGDVKNGKNYTAINSNIRSQKSNTQKVVLDCFRKRTYKSKGTKYRITQMMVLKKI